MTLTGVRRTWSEGTSEGITLTVVQAWQAIRRGKGGCPSWTSCTLKARSSMPWRLRTVGPRPPTTWSLAGDLRHAAHQRKDLINHSKKQLQCPSVSICIKKMWLYTYTFFPLKKQEILPFATTCMNLLSKSDTRICATWSHLYEKSKIVKLTEAESRMAVIRGWGEGESGRCWS